MIIKRIDIIKNLSKLIDSEFKVYNNVRINKWRESYKKSEQILHQSNQLFCKIKTKTMKIFRIYTF